MRRMPGTGGAPGPAATPAAVIADPDGRCLAPVSGGCARPAEPVCPRLARVGRDAAPGLRTDGPDLAETDKWNILPW